MLEAGFETAERSAVGPATRVSRDCLFVAKGDAPAGRAGFHAIAPDLRGYGRTTGWCADYDADLRPFRLLNAVRDTLGLVFALGFRRATAVIGHDLGASVAGWCAVVRPDAFASLVLMSAPFEGPPDLPFDVDGKPPVPPASPDIHEALASLPRPRKHYQWYYSKRAANAQIWHCKQGVHAFLRAYFHHKSTDWAGNKPYRLTAWSANDWGKYQRPGAMERMLQSVCTHMTECHLIEGAGHWVQQEQPEMLAKLLIEFLGSV